MDYKNMYIRNMLQVQNVLCNGHTAYLSVSYARDKYKSFEC